MPTFARRLVSKKKRRYEQDGFSLDLAYITDRIIAMGYPSQGTEAMYRNPMQECKRFLEERHKDHYKVYNLCAERAYDPLHFDGRVEHFPFYDHQACPLPMIFELCKSVQEYLDKDPKNVVVIHCKAGKGRTGLMITAYLVYSQMFPTVDEALAYYGEKRTHNGKGVTIASQQRYVRYFHHLLQTIGYAPEPVTRTITGITAAAFAKVIDIDQQLLWQGEVTGAAGEIAVPVTGDFKIELFGSPVAGMCGQPSKRKKLCHVWMNSFFVDEKTNSVVFKKTEADKSKKLPDDFSFEVFFQPMESGQAHEDSTTSAEADSAARVDDVTPAVSDDPMPGPLPASVAADGNAAAPADAPATAAPPSLASA